ncbi:MAG: hypothetical protein AAF902_00835 [Chloroflexota bacterium]
MDQDQTPQNNGWQNRFLVAGALIGALAGLVSAWMLVKSAEKKHDGPPEISNADLLKSTVGVIGIIRAIASLGD